MDYEQMKRQPNGRVTRRSLAWIAGITTLITASAGLLTALATIDITTLVQLLKGDEENFVPIDAEYAVSSDANVWKSEDLFEEPIARLPKGTFVWARAKVENGDFIIVELEKDRLGYVVSNKLVSATVYRNENKVSQLSDYSFLFGVRASASWEDDVPIYNSPNVDAESVGILTAGRKLGHDVFYSGEVAVLDRVESGKWYKVGSGGRVLGFVESKHTTELWPTGVVTYEKASEAVIFEMESGDGATTKLGRGPNYLRLETTVKCELDTCTGIQVYSSSEKVTNGPHAYTGHRIRGSWRNGENISIFSVLPVEFLNRAGNDVICCVGNATACVPQRIIYVKSVGEVTS